MISPDHCRRQSASVADLVGKPGTFSFGLLRQLYDSARETQSVWPSYLTAGNFQVSCKAMYNGSQEFAIFTPHPFPAPFKLGLHDKAFLYNSHKPMHLIRDISQLLAKKQRLLEAII